MTKARNPRHEQARLDAAKAKPTPLSKTELLQRAAIAGMSKPLVGAESETREPDAPLPAPLPIEPTTTTQLPAVISQDQTNKAGDQNNVKATKKKKLSTTVVSWKAQQAFSVTAKITNVVKDNPKRKDAYRRFSWYREGMTVQEYIDEAKKNNSPGALAMADIRWDHVKGFIKVVE
jgi:hypothetical protein